MEESAKEKAIREAYTEIKTIKGDRIDPTLYALFFNGVSVFESHDKKQTLKAEQLLKNIINVADLDIDTVDLDHFINGIISN